MFTIAVLGPVTVRLDGATVAVPAGKTSELLVRLALDAGNVVRADRLVDDLWGADAVATSRNTLQSKATKLRRVVGPLLVSGDGGYRLDVSVAEVDALAVVALASSVPDDDVAAADACAAGLQLFAGELLPGAGTGEWVEPFRARLAAAQLQLIETECAARLQLGQLGEVIVQLEAAVAAYPYQESLWVLLITALYRAGRQADALAAYQRVRVLLADELGLEPGPQLRHVENRILAQDESLAVAARELAPVGNLPTMVTELVGRSSEVAAVTDLLGSRPLVEIVGPGGIGKTALALAVARELSSPGGVWLARLETTTTADEVVDSVIAALGVVGGVPALLERLKATPSVLVLDNCEHVIAAAADLVERVLDAAPHTRILCTTQVALDIEGSALVELAPLGLADAVELFTRRATRGNAEDSAELLRDVCRSLDGLPLAIELAAARTKTLSVAEIGRRLDDRLDLLNDPTSRRPERRRALRATIGWSYELLFADDQRGLWALATFAGGATLPAIEHVLQALDVPSKTAIDVVSRLAARSLLIVDQPPPEFVRSVSLGATQRTHLPTDAGGETRYRLLDSIRAFALEAMTEAGLTDAAHAAHARWFADLARRSTEGVRSADQSTHLAVAQAERSNIDAALNWCVRHDPQLAVTIANGFGWAWIVLGDARGAQRILTALQAANPPPHERAEALLLVAWFEASTGDLDHAREHLDEVAALATALDDIELRARHASYLSYVAAHGGDFRGGIAESDRSRSLFAGLDRPWDAAANELFAARPAISLGDEALAVAAVERTTRALERVDDPWLHIRFEGMRGELARLQHRFDDAVEHIRRAATGAQQRGFLQTEAYQVASLGRAQCQAGDYEGGAATLQRAVQKAEATGDTRMAALARVHLGRVLRALADNEGARTALEHTVAWHRAAGGGEQAVLGEVLLAAMNGDADQLQSLLQQAEQDDNAPAEVLALDALARLTDDEALRARADERMRAANHFITERDRVDVF